MGDEKEKCSMGWHRILAFCVSREGKLKSVKGLLVRRLLIGQ